MLSSRRYRPARPIPGTSAIIRSRRADTERLVEAARLEIWEHITFWDDVYYAILGMENELAS